MSRDRVSRSGGEDGTVRTLVRLRAGMLGAAMLGILGVLPGTALAYEDPCRDTEACQQHGRCYAVPLDDCDTGEQMCRMSYDCLHRGQCAFDAATEDCYAASGDHCRLSMDCDDYGRCALDVASRSCEVGALECHESNACELEARCTLRDGRCVVGADEDCANSTLCSVYGQCAHVAGHCVATQADHCSASRDCDHYGRCYLVNAAGEEVSSLTTGGVCGHAGRCADSVVCRQNGGCAPGPRNRCAPTSAEHCRASVGCVEEGRCTFLPPPEPPAEQGALVMMQASLTPQGPACIVGGPEDCEAVCAGREHCEFTEDFMGGANRCQTHEVLRFLGEMPGSDGLLRPRMLGRPEGSGDEGGGGGGGLGGMGLHRGGGGGGGGGGDIYIPLQESPRDTEEGEDEE